MTKLATYTVGAGGDSSVTFSNIPQTYTDLVVKASARTARTASTINILNVTFNGVTTNQTARIVYGDASGLASTTDTNIWGLVAATDACTASTFGNSELTIPNYTSANYKSMFSDGLSENVGATAYTVLSAGLWSSTAAITSISFASSTSNTLKQYSTFTLYGVKAMRNAVGNKVKATGGTIAFDGTFVTHTFNSTATFTPTTNLLVDYLVVAGGGGGGGNLGGGGGAGGLRSTVTATGGGGSLESALSLASGTNYTVTIGAGGAAGAANARGANGSDSGFASIASLGGGGGASDASTIGLNGGSGGGACGTDASSGTANQGYAGSTKTPSDAYASGAGGGAGAVGGISSLYRASNGGIGVATSISGSPVYYAGGGGGSYYNSSTQGFNGVGGEGGGGRGGNNLSTTNLVVPTSGTANTGGGGGGRGWATASNNINGDGGSGIVIVRYKG
jgi:hypothetical protein